MYYAGATGSHPEDPPRATNKISPSTNTLSTELISDLIRAPNVLRLVFSVFNRFSISRQQVPSDGVVHRMECAVLRLQRLMDPGLCPNYDGGPLILAKERSLDVDLTQHLPIPP
jgi:hypothetical protein